MLQKIFTSLRYRIAASIFILEATMMIIVLGQTLAYSQQSTRSQLHENEEVILNLLANLSQTALFNVEFGELQQYMDEVIQDPHVMRVLVADSTDTVVISTEFADVGQPLAIGPVPKEERFWRTKSMQGLGVIAIEFSNRALLESRAQILQMGVGIALTGMFIIAIAGFGFGYLLTRRLSVVIEAAEQAAEGDLDVRTGFKGDDEVELMGRTFDKMAERISHNMAELDRQKQELAAARDDLECRVDERTKELQAANEKLHRLTEVDPLTGIANRRRFDFVLKREWQRVIRDGGNCAVLMIDIDFFKLFNDFYGHQQGDDCIVKVAQMIQDTSSHRATDLAARYGGEEFVVILPDTDLRGAQVVAEKIRTAVEALQIPHEKSSIGDHVTISVGITSNCAFMLDQGAPSLVKCADHALYQAKKQGRNRVVGNCMAKQDGCILAKDMHAA